MLDLFDILLQSGLITGALVLYLLIFKKETPSKGAYKNGGWNYSLRLLFARFAVSRWKSQLKPTKLHELPRTEQYSGWDNFSVRATAPDGSTLLLSIRKLCGRQPLAEVVVHVKLPDGTTYKLPQHPDTAVCAWDNVDGGWSANGLKFQVLDNQERYRFLYNGLLTRVEDGVTQHVKLNLLWSSATHPIKYPEDWNNKLAAETLALETWSGAEYAHMLGKWEEGGWLQWGTVQGRFLSFTEVGDADKSVYLQTRGVKERRWAPHAYEGLRRSVAITASAKDGTAVQLHCLSYKNVLTHCISGCVRYPDFTSSTINYTDLQMSDFCERPDGIPNVYTIQVSTDISTLKLVLRINPDGGKLFSGVPYQQEIVYRTMQVDINCESGTGILELGYEPLVISEPSRIAPARLLKWLTEKQAGEVGYCVSFEDRGAACPMYVGGKGASLALLASVQKEEGYRVPPGFCLTTKALEKHLELNPELIAAIREIEAANEDYNENNFKEKCKTASELLATTEIRTPVREEILEQIKMLRSKATEQNLGPELRFAVRSSAVGEDSEELSAAGQNETILGCMSDADILEGVQKCWGSMFAFTSAYYRRQNGQECVCGGGVVVQALVAPRAAGVMFTRHPAHGDPSKLLITANYGLGESVVSGAVEPDTVIVDRDTTGKLSITKTELGSKNQRVKTEGSGTAMEDVPEDERNVACITNDQVLKLAKIGVSQEALWGAGRDIEWAVTETEIFLLQARPITSLDRWTDEELLHELDSPIMADDELLSFGNAGEVFPKPITPMTYDLVLTPLMQGMDNMTGTNGSGYDKSVFVTHNRCTIALYNTLYRKIPKELDVNMRLIELAIHGHEVADDQIIKTAKHRRPPYWLDKLSQIGLMIKTIATSKKVMESSEKAVRELNYDIDVDSIEELYNMLRESQQKMKLFSNNHAATSTASTCGQSIAMNVYLEGSQEFTPEQCNEIGGLFSSGDVLSAEVPVALANIVRQIEKTGRAEEFRALDPKKALEWLKFNFHDDIYVDVREFLEHHGYRAIMEFDLVTKPWVLVPEDMMKVLQNLRITNEEKTVKSSQDMIAALTGPQKPNTKKILSYVLPLCRRTVRHRESTKAHMILAIHKIRIGFLRLGRMMVRKWYIPHPELIFHFRLHELKNYITTRDPALLKKALQREQYHPGWCKLKFAEINTGWVKVLEMNGPQVLSGDVKMKATSVNGGDVVARACVVKDLSEIGDLRRGDVLITHATDIGWSPYFPLLTGIVTELGGLISHGAVIAREYGLPCIVGAAQATDIFKTGDLVRLSGSMGTIEKVEIKEDQPEEKTEEVI
ncbi:uncharacterized protein LOC113496983 [Trichoplusia ni]|uniref:Uncharacterized protein LOC113496983 n=1 Tax=Trichoplusia ni TaxID=7111 RepID=A0A7E5VVQ5_TRINI|nr:uncharacterized protein LOC113496983 [Trichoplusia ni]